MGMLIALTRRINLACTFQRERHWPEDYIPFRGDDLYGRTMGIVGYGSIGRQIARLGQAMGMRSSRARDVRKRSAIRLLDSPDSAILTAQFRRLGTGVTGSRECSRIRCGSCCLLKLSTPPALLEVSNSRRCLLTPIW